MSDRESEEGGQRKSEAGKERERLREVGRKSGWQKERGKQRQRERGRKAETEAEADR